MVQWIYLSPNHAVWGMHLLLLTTNISIERLDAESQTRKNHCIHMTLQHAVFFAYFWSSV